VIRLHPVAIDRPSRPNEFIELGLKCGERVPLASGVFHVLLVVPLLALLFAVMVPLSLLLFTA
jgi:hypothetical protein